MAYLAALIPALAAGAFACLLTDQTAVLVSAYSRRLRVEARLLGARQDRRGRAFQLIADRLIYSKVFIAITRRFGIRDPAKAFQTATALVLLTIPIAIVLGSLLQALFLLALILAALVYWAKNRSDTRQQAFSDQLPAVFKSMAAALAAGQSIRQALDHAAGQSVSPAKEELRAVVEEMALGLSLDKALSRLQERMPAPELEMMIMGLHIQKKAGGNLVDLLEKVTAAVEEKRRLYRELMVQTAQARLSAKVIGMMPLIVMLALFVLDPSFLAPLFSTSGGLVMLGFAVLFETLGFLVLAKILDVRI